MKIEPRRLADCTDAAILAEVRRVADLVNGPSLSTAEFNKYARVGLTTVRRRFGGWRQALEAAGIGHLYNEVPEARVSRTLARGWNKEQVVEELNRVAMLIGRDSLTVEEFKQLAMIGADAVRRRFGSWREALLAARLEPVNHGRRYTDEECFENFLSVWTHYGRPPKYQEMNKTPSSMGGKAYVTRWGTWNRAIHAFTDYVDSDAEAANSKKRPPAQANNVVSPSSSAPRPADRREPSIGIRYRVLRTDRFRCVLCGRVPRLTSDANCTSTT